MTPPARYGGHEQVPAPSTSRTPSVFLGKVMRVHSSPASILPSLSLQHETLLSSFHPLLLLLTSPRHPKEVQAGMFYAERGCTDSFCVWLCLEVPLIVRHILNQGSSRSPPAEWNRDPPPSPTVNPTLQPLQAVAFPSPASPAAEKRGWVRSPTPASSPGSPAASASPFPSTSHTHTLPLTRARAHSGDAAPAAAAASATAHRGSPPL